jgi:hypothetical protein
MSIKRLIHERCAVERAPDHLRAAVLRLIHSSSDTLVIDYELETEMRMELEER